MSVEKVRDSFFNGLSRVPFRGGESDDACKGERLSRVDSGLHAATFPRSFLRGRQAAVFGAVLPVLFLFWLLPGSTLAQGVSHREGEGVHSAAEIRQYSVLFLGNAVLSAGSLRQAALEELADLDDSPFPEARADDAAFMMELAYRRLGHAFATVEYRFFEENGRHFLEFAIAEGPRVEVESIRITGNSRFSSSELQAFFSEGSRSLPGGGALPFVETEVRDALAAVRDLYLSEGYARVVVDEPIFSFSPDRSRVAIHCRIQEGEQRLLVAAEFAGEILAGLEGELAALAGEMSGRPYVPRRRLQIMNRVRELYADRGYPEAEIVVEEAGDSDFARVRLLGRIRSGPPVTIAGVRIEGNERTGIEFIRSRLRLLEGDPYSTEKKRESFQRLYQSGLFSRVVIELDPGPTETERNLLVQVEEVAARELFLQGGWGSYELLRASGGFQENNLLGTGRIFRLEGGGSVRSANVQASFIDPWLLGSDISADLPVYFRRRQEPSFTREERGTALFLARDLSRTLSLTMGYLYRENTILDIASEADAATAESDYTVASIRAHLSLDTRDDIFFPTTGHRAFLTAEIADALLGSGVAYQRLTLGLRKFLPLGRRNTLGLRYDTGIILPGRDQVIIPLGERFFNGGENSVRSFRESELGPKDSLGEPLGGNGFQVISIELRHRFTDQLAGSIFIDYGNVSPGRSREEEGLPPHDSRSQVIEATINDYFRYFRPGLGLGVQYLLPVGPARLDIAWNPDRDRERHEEGFALHFSIGMAF